MFGRKKEVYVPVVKKSVSSIMSVFTNAIKDLKQVEDDMMKDIKMLEANEVIIAKAKAEATKEAEDARAMIVNLTTLVGTKGE